MKHFASIIISLICLVVFPISVNAASGSIRITGTSSAVVGNTVSITVTLSSSTPILNRGCGTHGRVRNFDAVFVKRCDKRAEPIFVCNGVEGCVVTAAHCITAADIAAVGNGELNADNIAVGQI